MSVCPGKQAAALRLLEEMNRIDSTTKDKDGVQAVQMIVQRELEAMGFAVRRVPSPTADSADLLVAEFEGESSGQLVGRDQRFVLLVGHADTVLSNVGTGPEGLGAFRVDHAANRAFGAGIIDDKGGLVVALRGLRAYFDWCASEGRGPRLSLRFVCSPNEEAGSPGFTDVFRTLAADSVIALGFEPALENGNVVESRRGNRWYHIEVHGRAGHAGRSKGEHVNAAHELSIKIAHLHELNDLSRGVSVNVGHIEGGLDAYNVICGRASCKLDTRFATFADRDRLHADIERILQRSFVRSADGAHGCSTTYSLADDCPPFSGSGLARPFIECYLDCVAKVGGGTVRAERAGGAGDVNYMSDRHVSVIDGLGAVGGAMHTPGEFIDLPSLVIRSDALAEFLARLEKMLAE